MLAGGGRLRPDATRVTPSANGRGASRRVYACTRLRSLRELRRGEPPGAVGAVCLAFARLRELRRGTHRNLHNVKQPADKPDRSGKAFDARAAVSLAPPQSRGGWSAAKRWCGRRRTRWPALRPGRSLLRKGPPVHVADRRALRRFTAEILVGQGPTRSRSSWAPRTSAGEAEPAGSAPCSIKRDHRLLPSNEQG